MNLNETTPMEPFAGVAPTGIQLPLCEKTVTTDTGGDFSLPDYQPEIKRLLRIGVSVLPPARYAGNGSMDLGGTIDYFVMYMGNDDQLYCAPLSSEYRFTVPAEGEAESGTLGAEPTVCTCDIVPETTSGRVTAPRRLNLRCRLKAKVKIYGEKSLDCADESMLTPGSVERLEGQREVGRLFWGMGDLLELQDDVILSPSDGDLRVVCAEGQVMVTEATAGSHMVNCRGEVTVKLTVCPEVKPLAPDSSDTGSSNGGAGISPLPTVMLRKIPFAQAVEVEGVTPGCDCCAHGTCSELSVEVGEGQIHVDVGMILEVLAQRNELVKCTKDLYSTRTESVCKYVDYHPQKALKAQNGNFTLSDSVALSDAGIDPAARVADVIASASPEELIFDKGRYILTGVCRAQLLLCKDSEYNGAELSLPFRYEMEAPAGADATTVPAFDGCVTVVNCRARMDGERIGLDAELAVTLRVCASESMTALSGITFGSDIKRSRGEYVICFPAPTDTLWTVAKRYHAPLSVLSAANSLPPSAPDSPESLKDVGYLIV